MNFRQWPCVCHRFAAVFWGHSGGSLDRLNSQLDLCRPGRFAGHRPSGKTRYVARRFAGHRPPGETQDMRMAKLETWIARQNLETFYQ